MTSGFQLALLSFFVIISLAQSIEPILMTVAGGALAGSWLFYDQFRCSFTECCRTPDIKHNITEFETLFDMNVFGQHLVRDVVSKALKSHLRKVNSKSKQGPRKALVLSFHGWTGGGKNYVTQFIAESMFKHGLKSKYVHLFISTLHFPDEKKTDIYKLDLQDWIRGNVSECAQSLFIFDEIDKMGTGLIDAIKPFIDFHESIHGVDFRKSIFVFLSNTGGQQLTKRVFEAWKSGRARESITYQELEELVQLGAFNEVGGLHQSSVIQQSLVDHFVPFLPLERGHVKKCVIVEAAKRGRSFDSDQIDRIVNDLTYWPPAEQLYSTTGCKRVGQKVDMLIEELEDAEFD